MLPEQKGGTSTAHYAVGHYSRPDHVLTVTTKTTPDGLFMQMNSFAGKQLAMVRLSRSSRDGFVISMAPEVDMFLVLASMLATCVASQFVIDELQTIYGGSWI